MSNKRIEFIDLAKGLCIILVVMYHCGLIELFPGDKQLRMPLYFVLSGLFFKDYGKDSFIKKSNKLLIPYITFYILGDLFYWIAFKIGALHEAVKETPVLDIFWGGVPSDLPIWFLLCLFNCYILFLVISRISKNKIQIVAYTIIGGAVGIILSILSPHNTIFFISNAFSSLPFFCLGYLLRDFSIFQYSHNRIIDFVYGCVLYCFAFILIYYFPDSKFSVFDNTFYGNILISYLVSGILVLSVLLICKSFKKIPFVSFIGKFSIIILLIHVPIMEIVYYFQKTVIHYDANWLRAFLTIMISSVFIVPMKNIMPYICAQKDLLSKELVSSLFSKLNFNCKLK